MLTARGLATIILLVAQLDHSISDHLFGLAYGLTRKLRLFFGE